MALKIVDLLNNKNKDAFGNGPATIGFLGDSVTNGCFEVLPAITDQREEGCNVIYDTEHSYSADLRKVLNYLYPKAQINIINAGISGDNAPGGLARMDRDLLPYHPDLTVVCFGLNDCTQGTAGLETYHDALVSIVRKLKQHGSEVVLMTPSPVCTRVHTQLRGESLRKIGKDLVRNFQDGIFDRYMEQVRAVAKEEGVPLCDVYAKWMTLYNNGVDITNLLSNYLNHPSRQMHWLFAVSLAETFFS